MSLDHRHHCCLSAPPVLGEPGCVSPLGAGQKAQEEKQSCKWSPAPRIRRCQVVAGLSWKQVKIQWMCMVGGGHTEGRF